MDGAVRVKIDAVIPGAEVPYHAGDYAASAALLVPLADTNPPSASALHILGLCRLRFGEPIQALDLLARAFNLAPDDPWTGPLPSGRDTEAVPLIRICQKLLPDDPAPSVSGSRRRVVRYCDQTGAAVADAWVNPGVAHYCKGDIDVACGPCKRSCALIRVTIPPGRISQH